MSRKDARTAVARERQQQEHPESFIMLFVQTAVQNARFHSYQMVTALFIAANASQQ